MKREKITPEEAARLFWKNNDPFVRMQHVKGFSPLTYGANYYELTPAERRKVESVVISLER